MYYIHHFKFFKYHTLINSFQVILRLIYYFIVTILLKKKNPNSRWLFNSWHVFVDHKNRRKSHYDNRVLQIQVSVQSMPRSFLYLIRFLSCLKLIFDRTIGMKSYMNNTQFKSWHASCILRWSMQSTIDFKTVIVSFTCLFNEFMNSRYNVLNLHVLKKGTKT